MAEFLPFRVLRLLAAAAFFNVLPLSAAPREVIRSAPPQPIEQSVKVQRGGSVDIPLRIYGTRAQTLSWIVRQAPTHGKLSDLRATSAEAALITYTPADDLRFRADRFTFSVRSNEGVSGATEVRIAIVDEEPRLTLPAELDFGALLVGEKSERTLEFTNAGGGIAEGQIVVEAPWRLESSPRYRLRNGERATAKLVFAPERSGPFESEFRCSSQADRSTTLRGLAQEPLAVFPPTLILATEAQGRTRAAAFELRNHTDQALEVTVISSQRLLFPSTLTIAPHEAAPLLARLAEDDVAEFAETVRFAAGSFTARLPMTAKALPALLSARPEVVSFRRARAAESATERVVLENAGGVAAELALSTRGPFSIQENRITLGPKEQRELVITSSGSSGNTSGALRAISAAATLEVPLEVRTVGVSAASDFQPVASVSTRVREAAPEPLELADPTGAVWPAQVRSVERNRATFSWHGQLPASGKLRCLQRTLALDAAGNLVANFADFPNCTFAQSGPEIVATVEKLKPGVFYFFRVDHEPGAGQPAIAQVFTSLRTGPPEARKPFFTTLTLLVIAALFVGCAAGWQRWRSRRLP